MEAEYAYVEALQDQFYWREEVITYTKKFTDQQLILEAKEVLSEKKSFVQQNLFVNIRSIITHGIVHNHLSEKQRFALGDFILKNS